MGLILRGTTRNFPPGFKLGGQGPKPLFGGCPSSPQGQLFFSGKGGVWALFVALFPGVFFLRRRKIFSGARRGGGGGVYFIKGSPERRAFFFFLGVLFPTGAPQWGGETTPPGEKGVLGIIWCGSSFLLKGSLAPAFTKVRREESLLWGAHKRWVE